MESYPICAVDSIQIYSNAQLTTQVIKECLKEGVTINYFNSVGKYLGKLESEYPKNTMRRLQQYQLYWNNDLRLIWAKQLIKAKIQSELIEIRRLSQYDVKFPFKEMRKELKEYLSKVDSFLHPRRIPEYARLQKHVPIVKYGCFADLRKSKPADCG